MPTEFGDATVAGPVGRTEFGDAVAAPRIPTPKPVAKSPAAAPVQTDVASGVLAPVSAKPQANPYSAVFDRSEAKRVAGVQTAQRKALGKRAPSTDVSAIAAPIYAPQLDQNQQIYRAIVPTKRDAMPVASVPEQAQQAITRALSPQVTRKLSNAAQISEQPDTGGPSFASMPGAIIKAIIAKQTSPSSLHKDDRGTWQRFQGMGVGDIAAEIATGNEPYPSSLKQMRAAFSKYGTAGKIAKAVTEWGYNFGTDPVNDTLMLGTGGLSAAYPGVAKLTGYTFMGMMANNVITGTAEAIQKGELPLDKGVDLTMNALMLAAPALSAHFAKPRTGPALETAVRKTIRESLQAPTKYGVLDAKAQEIARTQAAQRVPGPRQPGEGVRPTDVEGAMRQSQPPVIDRRTGSDTSPIRREHGGIEGRGVVIQPQDTLPAARDSSQMTTEEFTQGMRISKATSSNPAPRATPDTAKAVPEPLGIGELVIRKGPEIGDTFTVYDGDKIVASYDGENLIVRPQYQRRGVAAELVAQYHTAFPNAPRPTRATPAAKSAIEAGHRLMVERAQSPTAAPTPPAAVPEPSAQAAPPAAEQPSPRVEQAPAPAESAPKAQNPRITALDAKEAEMRARIAKRGGVGGKQSGSVLGPDDFMDLAHIGALKIAKGAIRFEDWSKQMIADFGEAIREHLPNLWRSAQAHYDSTYKEERAPVAEPAATPGEGGTTGIAQRVQERLASEGKAAPYVPGKGISPEESITHGRELIRGGVDPEQVMSGLEKRPGAAASAEDIGVMRAHYEGLQKAQDRALDAAAKNPRDRSAYEQAVEASAKWYDRYAPYRTEASNVFRAMQGETELDTGSFHGIARAFTETHKRPMTPQEIVTARGHAERVKALEAELAAKDAQLKQAQATQPRPRRASTTETVKIPTDRTGLAAHIADLKKSGALYNVAMQSRQAGAVSLGKRARFSADLSHAIWEYSKSNYIDRGHDYGSTVDHVAADLGLTPEEVKRAYSSNKSVREVSQDYYALAARRRAAIRAAKTWVETRDAPGYMNVLRAIERVPFSLAVFVDGTVGMVTHAGENIFRPSGWPVYWKNYGRMYRIFFGVPGEGSTIEIHEAMMQSIEHSDNYGLKLKAGLAVEPGRIYDSYQDYMSWLGKAGGTIGEIGERGNRGMDVLKKYRSDYFDREWSRLPKDLQTPEMAAQLSEWINHISGTAKGPVTRAVGRFMFAPSLESSRWARMVGDPIKTANVFGREAAAKLGSGAAPTPEESYMARFRVKRAAEVATVLVGALLANRGLQMARGEKDLNNLTDPTKSDWMKFKLNGKTYDPTGGVVNPIRFLSTVLYYATAQKPETYRGQGRRSAIIDASTFYAQGKVSPFYQLIGEGLTRETVMGRPTPFSEKKGTPSKPRYGWGEYALEHGPIPASEASKQIYETFRAHGMDTDTSHAIMDALEAFGIASLGVHEGNTPKPRVKAKSGTDTIRGGARGSRADLGADGARSLIPS